MTVWFDFTTSLRNRSRNGIANVEWSVGTALLSAHPDVRCFSLQHAGLTELDPATLGGTVYASGEAGPVQVTLSASTWRDAVRAALLATGSAYATPAIRLLSAVYQAPQRAVRRVRGVGVTLAQRRAAIAAPSHQLLRNLVGPGDVVVSLGADWEGELAQRLAELRERTGCRVVTMAYDLIPLTHTHLAFHNDPALFRRYFSRLVRASDLVTCISEQSRRDLLAFAEQQGLQVARAEVLRLGEAPVGLTPERSGEDYFLWVGTVERRKNLELLYDALRIIESEGGAPPRIVVAGSRGWGTDDLLEELQLQSTAASRAMWLIGGVEEPTLERLYAGARALLFPSHYEGWGLPVREAAVRGLPVAAGDSPAVREAAAGYAGATLLPTDDPGPWADYLRTVPTRVDPLPIRPWSDTARDLIGYIESLPSTTQQ